MQGWFHSFPPSSQLCLEFLDAVVCYSTFPTATIHCFVIALCHTLNIERFIQRSLEVGGATWGGCGYLTQQPPSRR